MDLSTRLTDGDLILIDGGTGTELELRDVPMVDGAWSAAGALSHPEVLQAVHESYLEAGAEVIIANTYACSRHLLEQAGLGDRFEEVNRAGIELAIAARDQAGSDAVVAGSISTTNMFGDWPTEEVARRNYTDQVSIQAAAGAEIMAMEMMRDIVHTQILLDAVAEAGLPAWLGYSCVMREGEPWLFRKEQTLSEAIRALEGQPVDVLAIMHTEVTDIDACLDVIQDLWRGPIGVYAHAGDFIPPHWQFHDVITPADHTQACLRWVDRGVQVIGGCCGIGPSHITHLRDELASRARTPS